MINIGIQEGIYIDEIDFGKNYSITLFNLENKDDFFHQQNKKIDWLVLRANVKITQKNLDDLKNLKGIILISTGTDNLPLELLLERNIKLYTAQGSNANAVCDYVKQSLILLFQRYPEKINSKIGIVGMGKVGSKVAKFLQRANLDYTFYDPFVYPKKDKEELFEADIITFHVPLTYKKDNEYFTYEMLNFDYFQRQKKDKIKIPLIIQSSRGKIWEQNFYKFCVNNDKVFTQDVYYHEPILVNEVEDVLKVSYTTPHIAGYSTIGRLQSFYDNLQKEFLDIKVPTLPKSKVWYLEEESASMKRNIYDLSYFNKRRNTFKFRKEFFEFTDTEKNDFMNRYSKVPDNVMSALWY